MISKEYAKALLSVAKDDNNLESICNDFDSFIKLINENDDYYKVLTYPNISNLKKKDSIKEVFGSFNEDFIYFLYVLIDNNQMNSVKEIYTEFEKLINEINKVKVVEVYSNSTLSKKDTEELIKKLKKSGYFNDYSIEVKNYVDESMVGGVRITCDGKLLDLSLDSRITNLRQSM